MLQHAVAAAAQVEGGGLVGGVEHVVLGVGVLGARLAQVRPHVVHQEPQPARTEAALRLAHESLAALGSGDVGLDGEAALAQQVGERRHVPRAGEHRASLLQQLLDDRAAQPLGAAGDDCRAAVEAPQPAARRSPLGGRGGVARTRDTDTCQQCRNMQQRQSHHSRPPLVRARRRESPGGGSSQRFQRKQKCSIAHADPLVQERPYPPDHETT